MLCRMSSMCISWLSQSRYHPIYVFDGIANHQTKEDKKNTILKKQAIIGNNWNRKGQQIPDVVVTAEELKGATAALWYENGTSKTARDLLPVLEYGWKQRILEADQQMIQLEKTTGSFLLFKGHYEGGFLLLLLDTSQSTVPTSGWISVSLQNDLSFLGYSY